MTKSKENIFLFFVASFLIVVFGIIVYFAIESNINANSDQKIIFTFENITELKTNTRETIKESRPIQMMQEIVDEKTNQIQEKITP